MTSITMIEPEGLTPSATSTPDPDRAADDGFTLVSVKNLGPLIDALDRADSKGYLPDAMADEWAAFEYRQLAAPPAPAQPAAPVQDGPEAQPETRYEPTDMRDGLESIRRYGLDTLSGRTDGPADAQWYRSAVNEMSRRARVALEAQAAAPAQPVNVQMLEALKLANGILDRVHMELILEDRSPHWHLVQARKAAAAAIAVAEAAQAQPAASPENSMADELKPCPFCGGAAALSFGRDSEVCNVRCLQWGSTCMGAGMNEFQESDAIDAWNRRAAITAAEAAQAQQGEGT